MYQKSFLLLAALLFSLAAAAKDFPVTDFGPSGDGETDDTAAFQKALDAAGEAGGGVVTVPRGRFRFDGALTVPKHVTLRGMHQYAPAHAGLRDKTDEVPTTGTVFEVYAGAGEEDGAPFITLNTNSVLAGVTVYYPDQDPQAETPTPYPYAIAMRGNNPAVKDVQLLNPYNGIDAGRNQRALIRNVHGQPLHIGIYVDQIYDIGRIENVHWNPWWSLNTPVYDWQMKHGRGFVFGRTDWHYVLNTFCFGYHVGYHFIETEQGAANGNFLGIGADNCHTALLADQTAPMGVLITNGEFVSFRGEDPTMLRVGDGHTGTLRLSNCAFWGPSNRNALIGGQGTVGLSDCTFMQWGHRKGVLEDTESTPSIEVTGGSVLIRGCEFLEDKLQVVLGPQVERAIITDNLMNGDVRIDNRVELGAAVVRDNLSAPAKRAVRRTLDEPSGFRYSQRRLRSGSEQGEPE